MERLDGWTRPLRDLAVGRLLKMERTLAFKSRIVRGFIFEPSCRPKSMTRRSRRGQRRGMCDKNKAKGSVAQHSLIPPKCTLYYLLRYSINSGCLTSALLHPSERSSKINTLPHQRRSDLVTPAALSRLGPMASRHSHHELSPSQARRNSVTSAPNGATF